MLRALLRREDRIWTLLAVTAWSVITVLSLLPGEERPHTGFGGNIEHMAAYAGAAAVTALAFRTAPLAVVVLPFSLASAVFEFAQLYIPGRSCLFENWLASTLGALAGALAAAWLLRPWLDRLIARDGASASGT